MLSHEENEILCRVGPGTLMGNLLRRYWMPACLSAELDRDGSPLEVRLLGEDLIAFRDTDGRVGLVDVNCPHRGASLYYGRNEDCGLRCIYHGWKFDVDGNCTEMPSERRSFADRIKLPNYPVHESGGIVWTYMGPVETMTPFRDFGTEDLEADEVQATKLFWDCNWVQALEGNIDTAHISHLHQWFGNQQVPDNDSDQPGYPDISWLGKLCWADRAPAVEVQDEWYGFRYVGIRDTPKGYKHVRLTAFTMPSLTIIAAVPFSTRQLIVVPIDDHSSWRYSFKTGVDPNPKGYGASDSPVRSPHRMVGPSERGIRLRTANAANHYEIDREFQKTESFSGIRDFVAQDYAVTESMGPIYNRTKEHLGTTDLAVIRMRSMLLGAARGLAEGKEPPGLTGQGDFRIIRSAEKVIEPNEDWRPLGTDEDPGVIESYASLTD
ncbi:MAG: Rieske 2Fe-2S domain-containing protein [Acidimicrobiaceae bacterium]|nr:Rieske 2Fe-2S domain-containing protein [Acidimicrobiaceae bacterium]